MKQDYTNEQPGIRYELVGDYYLPIDFGIKSESKAPSTAPKDTAQPDRPSIGRFGRAHKAYLKQNQRHVYSSMAANGTLCTYLAQIDEQANSMLELLIRQMAELEGITEQLKAEDQLDWVRRMNSIRSRAEEIVNSELIYC